MEPLVLGVIIVIAIVTLRVVASRRVAAGDARFVWVVFVPGLVLGTWLVWSAITQVRSAPLVEVPLTIGVNRARTPDEIADAITRPMTEHLVVWVSLLLMGGLVAVGALIVWGVSKAAS